MTGDEVFDRSVKAVLLMFGVLAAALVLLWGWMSNHPLVHVVNGLDIPLTVTATRRDSSQTITVSSGGRDSLRAGGRRLRSGASLLRVARTRRIEAYPPPGVQSHC